MSLDYLEKRAEGHNGPKISFERVGMIALASMWLCYLVRYKKLAALSAPWVLLPRWFGALRMILLWCVLALPGLIYRFGAIFSGDRSALNRLSIWGAGIRLMAASPFRGWGQGNSGAAYMQWLQDGAKPVPTYGMSNSYLLIAVEFGMPALLVCTTLLLLPMRLAGYYTWAQTYNRTVVLWACNVSLIGFSIASIFSSLWLTPRVTGVPLTIACIILIMCPIPNWRVFWRLIVAPTLLTSLGLVGVLFFTGIMWQRGEQYRWRIDRLENRAVQFTPIAWRPGMDSLMFIADFSTLGPYYGFEIRSVMRDLNILDRRFVIYQPAVSPTASLGDTAILFGARAADLEDVGAASALCLVCPVGRPPPATKLAGKIRLIAIPEYDELGLGCAWQVWAKAMNLPVIFLSGTGRDVRGVLPEIMKSLIRPAN